MFTLKVCFLRRLNQSTTYKIEIKHYHIDSPQTRRCHAGNNNFYSWQTGDFPRKNQPSREEKCELSACKSNVSSFNHKVYLPKRPCVFILSLNIHLCVQCRVRDSETTSHCLPRSISLHSCSLPRIPNWKYPLTLAAGCWHCVEFSDVTQRGGPHSTHHT